MAISTNVNTDWSLDNQNYLLEAVNRIKLILEHRIFQIHSDNNQNNQGEKFHPPLDLKPSMMSQLSTLEKLCNTFRLSNFERDLLLLCAGIEIDRSWTTLFPKITRDLQINYLCLNVALIALPEAFWTAITPNATLRHWQMIELGTGTSLTNSPLRINERILHYLWGIQQVDQRLLGMLEPLPTINKLAPSHQKIADEIAAVWLSSINHNFPIIQLSGQEIVVKTAITHVACTQIGINLQVISAEALLEDITQLNLFQRLWEREAMLNNSVLLLDCNSLENVDANIESKISRFIETIDCRLIVSSRERRRSRQRSQIIFDIEPATTNEQRLIWQHTLSKHQLNLNSHIDVLVSHFNLNYSVIESVCLQAKSLVNKTEENLNLSTSTINNPLWNICRQQARLNLDDLAQRVNSVADWDNLILPEKELNTLREIAIHVRQRSKVYESWGFISKSKSGLGISALFSGQSGTGKTMSAEVLGNTLNLDVYRIDLSSIVSKYIGETEKNLHRVFDVAEVGGAILLFHEADALFGKRSDVKDSHDRYANMQVSYLLQKIESYRGLAILTTNLKTSIDPAFLRRLRFVVQFPFPDIAQREEIWKRMFPQKTPTEKLDFKKLSNLNVAGGNIRNIAINAAFLAAEANEPVMMKHILQAAKSEYVKLERPMTDNEVRGWI